jgi:hypothetical protein
MLTSEEIRGFMLDDGVVDGVHVKKEPSAPTENGAQALRSDAQEMPDIARGERQVKHGSNTPDSQGV